jgi:formate/nitrite transporter
MPERMLIIDDEDIVLESCRKVFTSEGFEVVTTDSPATGLKLISDSKFDVVLCDWKMPGFDGMDVVEEVDRRSPESAIVMISGFPTIGRATEAMKRGAMDYVSKPFTPEEISDAVKRAVRQKVAQEKKAIGRIEKIMKSIQFPVPAVDDRAPQTIAETIANSVGVKKATSPWLSVLVLGILAGAYIAFGGLLMTVVTFDMGSNFGIGFTKFMGGAVFTVGLMLVVIAGAELFTGNNLMVTSTLTRDITFGTMLRRWVLVYAANFVGSVLLAVIFVLSGLWKTGDGGLGAAAVKIAYNKINLTFVEALFRAIGCNWLVCLAVWMALASRQTVGKIFAIFFPIMAFVAIGFEHSVANMYLIPTGLFLNAWHAVALPSGADGAIFNWGGFLYRNLLPVTIGNIIGGGIFVGMSYWGAYLMPQKAKQE